MSPSQPVDRRGLAAAVSAYLIWGLFPLYWARLGDLPALEIIAHRVLWCAVFVSLWLLWSDGRGWLRRALSGRRVGRLMIASSLLISINWGVYIWAVTNGRVVDASLGYFMCPLVTVLLAVLILKERLSRTQILALALVAAAVLMLILALGVVPKIALFLAVTFGLYGLFRKRLPVPPTVALFLECALLVPVALLLLPWIAHQHGLVTPGERPWSFFLLAMAGVVTVGPLLLFGLGAHRLRLSTVGLLQYITPSMLFVEGVLFFREPLSPWRLLAFAMIWAALALYTRDSWRAAHPR